MNDFLSYILYLLQRGIWFAAPAVFLCVLALAGAWGVSRKKGRPFPWGRAAALLLLIGWLGVTLFVTLLRSEPGFREWNFHLFLAWREAWNQFALRAWLNVLLNIALFVPLGLLLPLLSHRFRSWYAMLPAGLAVSLAIELGQLATARGMFDVDDLFTNTLGAMVGWGMVLLIQTVRERSAGWKARCLGYLSVPAALALVLAGLCVWYAVKPYGNLQQAPAVTADLTEVQWKLEFVPEDGPATARIYHAGRWDKEACERFGAEFAQRAGFVIEDIYYYDDTIWFANHASGDFLLVNRLDGTWEYHLGRETTPVFAVPPEEIGSEEILALLSQWGMAAPEDTQFSITPTGGSGFYRAEAEVELDGEGEELFYGSLRCDLRYEAGETEVSKIYYDIVTLVPEGEEAILSPAQAVEALCHGHSFQGALLEREQARQITVLSCTLDWKGDTKGFYQPVYRFELQLGGETVTDYVAALQ